MQKFFLLTLLSLSFISFAQAQGGIRTLKEKNVRVVKMDSLVARTGEGYYAFFRGVNKIGFFADNPERLAFLEMAKKGGLFVLEGWKKNIYAKGKDEWQTKAIFTYVCKDGEIQPIFYGSYEEDFEKFAKFFKKGHQETLGGRLFPKNLCQQ